MTEEASGSNVRSMDLGQTEPEDVLRSALAYCAEMRSEGQKTYVVVLIGDDNRLPALRLSELLIRDLASCLARLQIEVNEAFSEFYNEEND